MEKLIADKKDFELEFDANKARWKYYKRIYPELNIDTDKLYLDSNNTRVLGRFDYSKSFTQIDKCAHNNTSIVLSGDSFFNFNEKKITAFKKNIELSEATVEILNLCQIQHQSNENCVLMPVTGGMNNVKGKAYFKNGSLLISGVGRSPKTACDRPDTLVFLIDQFYTIREKNLKLKEAGMFYKCSIFRDSLNTSNFPIYYDFMNSFSNAIEFCKLFFKLDEKLFNRMINSGGKPIEDEADLLSYLSLAQEYWEYRKH